LEKVQLAAKVCPERVNADEVPVGVEEGVTAGLEAGDVDSY
jgi:hypothetical protein